MGFADKDRLLRLVKGLADKFAAKDHTHADASTSAAGFMTAAMVTKLNGIATGANKTTVDSALNASSKNPVQNQAVYKAMPFPVTVTLAVNGWTAADSGYTQTKTLTKTAASGTFTPGRVSPPLTSKTGTAATDEEKCRALRLVAGGTSSFTVESTKVTVTVTVAEKPTCDLDVYWYLER